MDFWGSGPTLEQKFACFERFRMDLGCQVVAMSATFWTKTRGPVKCSCVRCCVVFFFGILVCLGRVRNGFLGVRVIFGTEVCLLGSFCCQFINRSAWSRKRQKKLEHLGVPPRVKGGGGFNDLKIDVADPPSFL